MFCFSRTNRSEIAALLSTQQNQTFSYSYVGYSRQQTPKGYAADRMAASTLLVRVVHGQCSKSI
jgi:hypothetical protein